MKNDYILNYLNTERTEALVATAHTISDVSNDKIIDTTDIKDTDTIILIQRHGVNATVYWFSTDKARDYIKAYQPNDRRLVEWLKLFDSSDDDHQPDIYFQAFKVPIKVGFRLADIVSHNIINQKTNDLLLLRRLNYHH